MPMITTVKEVICRTISMGIRITTAFFIYCVKEKKESVSQLPQYFLEHRTPMVFTPTHVNTEKYILCYVDCLLTIDCEKKKKK